MTRRSDGPGHQVPARRNRAPQRPPSRPRAPARRGGGLTTYLADRRSVSSARGVQHTALISSDAERTIRFHQEVLKFPLTEIIENRGDVRHYGAVTPAVASGTAASSGVFLAALADGLTPEDAARRANAAAALSATRAGPAASPTRAELDTWLASRPGPRPCPRPCPRP